MRRRQAFAAMTLGQLHAEHVEIVSAQVDHARAAIASVQTEMRPSDIMMLSEAEDGPPPCPKCGKPLGVRGRHLHIRRCNG